MNWKIEKIGKMPDLDGSIMITGLPGIGNVGKIVADFVSEELKTKTIVEFFSYYMPHSVFVTENNLIELPKIKISYKKVGKNKILVLTGDSQPIDEVATYEFCDTLVNFFIENKGKEIVTIGGIGLENVPKKPKVYLTGTEENIVSRYKKGTKINTEIYGVVGPIMGVSGVLLGLSKRKNIPAISILAETLGHPMFLGLKGSREILKVLDKKLSLKMDLKNLDKEIKDIEARARLVEELESTRVKGGDVNYIG